MPTQYKKYTLDNNTNKTTITIHTVNQQQLHRSQLKTSNRPPETSYNTACTKGKNTQIVILKISGMKYHELIARKQRWKLKVLNSELPF